jgi:fumigallin biosynthesis monooxygenase-like protein
MTEIFGDRYTARVEKPVVLFLIGMRLNNLLAVGKWLPVATAMPRMLAELAKKPETGLLFYRTYISGRVILVQEYWESFDKLLAYAHDRSGQHFPAWAAFNRAVGTDGSVGIWHETYLVEPGKSECIYANMPRFGLAAAALHVKAEGRLAAAKDRLASRLAV